MATHKARPIIDWEAIERDYRIGQLSIREIARRHNVEASSITRRSKKEEWARDYTEEVRARTRAGLIETAKQQAAQHSEQHAATLRNELDLAVATNLAVLRSHQVSIRQNAQRLDTLTQQFDDLAVKAADLNEMSKAAGAFESLVRAQKSLVALEREALNIDKTADEESGSTYERNLDMLQNT